ncbi:MAG: DUF4129 domain-containing protein [Halobacteriota archaeon]
MHGFRRKAQLTCILSAILLVLTAGYASAQSFPSQTELNSVQSGGFDFPTQLPLFASLAADANGAIVNVTTGNFSNASALLAHYNSTINQITSSTNASQQGTTIAALHASQGSFTLLIADAQRFNALNASEAGLMVAAPRGNASIANALQMQALDNALTGLPGTINGQNADIYTVAVQNGLDFAPYGNATALLNAYAAQVNGRAANVTGAVFVTPILTLTESANNATYGDTLALSGGLKSNQTGVSNVTVDVHVDNRTIATVSTVANGSYAYQLPILTIPAGVHVASVGYTPVDAPYKPAQSAPVNFSVAASPVNNTLSFLSPSIALGSNVQARGTLTTATGPVANGTVVLSLGGSNVASAQTDQNGSYSFSVSSLPFYVSAVPGGVTAYTVFDPSGQPLASAASAAVSVPADLTGLFGIIAGLVLAALLIVIPYRGGYLRRAPVEKEGAAAPVLPPAKEVRPIVVPVPLARVAEAAQQVSNWDEVLGEAREAFERADDENATKALFEAAVASLAVVAHVPIAAHMTHTEKSWAVAAALRDEDTRNALRQLTMAYELANFGDRTLTESQREAALSAFASLRSHVSGAQEST